jgi:hypothetical protein
LPHRRTGIYWYFPEILIYNISRLGRLLTGGQSPPASIPREGIRRKILAGQRTPVIRELLQKSHDNSLAI